MPLQNLRADILIGQMPNFEAAICSHFGSTCRYMMRYLILLPLSASNLS